MDKKNLIDIKESNTEINAFKNPYSNSSSESFGIENASLSKIIENYISYYAHSYNHTAKAKRNDLIHFLKYLSLSKEEDKILVKDWTFSKTLGFIDSRLQKGESVSTVSRRLATIKHLGRTLSDRIPGFINPAKEVKAPRIQKQAPYSLSENEVLSLRETIFEPLKGESFIELRNSLVLLVLIETGLRADEIRLLQMQQLSSDLSWFENVRTKGRQFRRVYIPKDLRGPLSNYLTKREHYLREEVEFYKELGIYEKSLTPLFVSSKNANSAEPLSFGLASKSIWRIINSLGLKSKKIEDKLLGKLHPHMLRHTFAHDLLKETKDIRLVAQALGHSDVRTTMRYTERSEEEIADTIEKIKARRS